MYLQCSKTCGEGLQTREVGCEQVQAPHGIVRIVEDQSKCYGQKPATHQKCVLRSCPQVARPTLAPAIDQDDGHYVQLKKQSKLILAVGGKATCIPHTTIVIKCNVKDSSGVSWTKGKDNRILIPHKGRIKVTKSGALRIRKSRESDANIYTCHVRASAANVTIEFHSEWTARELYQSRIMYINNKKHSNKVITDILNNTFTQLQNVYFRDEKFNSTVPFVYYQGHWSPCTTTCGGNGLQVRGISCEIITQFYFKVVNEDWCERLGLEKPLETRDCAFERCPQWRVGGRITPGVCSNNNNNKNIWG